MGAEDRGFMLERSADSPSGVMVDGLAGTESGGDKVGLTHGTDVELGPRVSRGWVGNPPRPTWVKALALAA